MLTFPLRCVLGALLASGRAIGAPQVTLKQAAAQSYDAIVCGAGVAGNLVAERLAASGAKTLLLERGPASTALSGGKNFVPWNNSLTVYDVPALATVVKDLHPQCKDTAGGAGCVFGGSGSINAMMFVPPSTWDFDDHWPTGWKWADIEPAYNSVLEFNPGSIHASSDGIFYRSLPLKYLGEMYGAHGWKEVDTLAHHDERFQVYGQPSQNVVQGQGVRAGPAHTLFAQALQSPNFSFSLNAFVVRVIRDGDLATGIEVQNNAGTRFTVKLNQGGKVVLTAGTLSTPRILFNSGIGPRDQIEIVQNGTTNVTLPPENDWLDLPVGQNLRDHPIVRLVIESRPKTQLPFFNSSEYFFGGWNQAKVDMYNEKAAGPLAQSDQVAVSFTHVKGSDGGVRYMQNSYVPLGPNQIRVAAYQTHGQTSSGSIGINADGDTVMLQKPFFNTEGDISASTRWVENYRNLLNNSAHLQLDPDLDRLTSRQLVEQHGGTGVHWARTTIIGESNDGTSVVDLNTKVWGMRNIFVADTSFHADVPTGNTQFQTMVCAEAAIRKILKVSV